ncbi:MAG TPA: hypothetical protein VLZ07_06740, partial [Syntrophales bacterium]|nr:hypothetical protein [Syntrophales bacterium]
DSPLAFSMEGFEGIPPPTLITRFWAPGWNSVQSVNKFQSEVGGPLIGGDSGARIFDAEGVRRASYLPVSPPPGRESRAGEILFVPVYHIFGSEELSIHSPAVAELCPAPYVALNPVDGGTLGLQDGEMAVISLSGYELHFPVRSNESFPIGVAGIPTGLPGLLPVALPAWGRIISEKEVQAK